MLKRKKNIYFMLVLLMFVLNITPAYADSAGVVKIQPNIKQYTENVVKSCDAIDTSLSKENSKSATKSLDTLTDRKNDKFIGKKVLNNKLHLKNGTLNTVSAAAVDENNHNPDNAV